MSRAGPRIAVSTSPGAESASAAPRTLLVARRAGAAARGAPVACVTTSAKARRCAPRSPTCAAKLDEIDKRDKEYKEQVVRLRKVLDQATELLTRNSADVGAKAAKAEQDIAALQGRIEELAHAMEQRDRADRRRRQQPARDAAGRARADADQDRRQGRARRCPTTRSSCGRRRASGCAAGQRDDGRRFYRVFIQRFPADPRAPQAYLAIGMSFVQESKFPNAAAEFQKVLDDLPAAPEVPEAMWQLSLGVRAAALLHRRALAARRSHEALPEVAARRRRQDRAQDHREAAQGQLHQLARAGVPSRRCSGTSR